MTDPAASSTDGVARSAFHDSALLAAIANQHRDRLPDHQLERVTRSANAKRHQERLARNRHLRARRADRCRARRARQLRLGSSRTMGRGRRTRSAHAASRRSSARSGDSGGEPGEPEPGRQCQAPGCTESLEDKRRDARTCSTLCRQRLARAQADESAAAASASADNLSTACRWLETLRLDADRYEVQDARAGGQISDADAHELLGLIDRYRRKLLGQQEPDCSHPIVDRDLDGDRVCVVCGHPAGPIATRINGSDDVANQMATNYARAA